MQAQAAQASVIENNFTTSEVQQFYFIDCAEIDCQTWIKEVVDNVTLVEETQVDEVEVTETTIVPENTIEWPYQTIRINEIVSAAETQEQEWVELFNTSSEPVSLVGWWIEEGAGTKTMLAGSIEGGGYLVFETKNLNNAGDLVALKDATGRLIDQVVYGEWDTPSAVEKSPVTVKGESLALYEGEYVANTQITKGTVNVYTPVVEPTMEVESVVEVVNESETPQPAGASNSEVEVIPQEAEQLSADVRLNEVVAAPAEGEEWIELYNAGTTDVDLKGWTIDDAEGGSSPYIVTESKIIKANDYLVLNQSETKLQLNNATDSVRLIDPQGTIIDSFNYSISHAGSSWCKVNTVWQETTIMTPGLVNAVPVVEPAITYVTTEEGAEEVVNKTINAEQLVNLDLRTPIMIEAAVTVLPGTFSKNVIYVQDQTGGIQVYFDAATWPEFELGRELMLTGTVSQSQGEKRILIKKVADIYVKDSSQLIEPTKIDTQKINSGLIGSLVEMEATLFEKDGSTWFLTDEFGGVKAYLKKGANIDSAQYGVNEKLKVVGILVKSNDEYVIQPRGEFDISKIIGEETSAGGTSLEISTNIPAGLGTRNINLGLGVTAGVLVLANIFLLLKKYLSKRKIKGLWYRFRTRAVES